MRASLSFVIAAGALCLAASPAQAAADYLLTIDGVKGDSMTAPGAIEVTSFQFGESATNVGAGSTGAAGRARVSQVTITKPVDSASPTLHTDCASGKHIPTVTLSVSRDGKPVETDTFSDVIISSDKTGKPGAGGRPTEELTLNFAKIEVVYAAQGAGPTAVDARLQTAPPTANPWGR